MAYNLIDELLTTHQVTDATFKAAKDKYGEQGVVDMIGLSGWYGLVSMLLNVDRYPLPEGVQPELKPLENPLPVVGMGFATPIPGAISPAEVKSAANGKEFTMRGDRFKPLTYEQMTPEQRKMTDIAVAQRGTGGSFNINVRDPDGGPTIFRHGGPRPFPYVGSGQAQGIGDHSYGALLGRAVRMAGSPSRRRAGRVERGQSESHRRRQAPGGNVARRGGRLQLHHRAVQNQTGRATLRSRRSRTWWASAASWI